MLLISDLQISLYQENIVAHAEVGKPFDPSTILTSSGGSGPNSLLPKEVIKRILLLLSCVERARSTKLLIVSVTFTK